MKTRHKVSFLVAGTQKGGTTAIHRMLQKVPGLSLPDSKELHFFNVDRYFRWPLSLVRLRFELAYERNFRHDRQTDLRGDCTPDYMYLGSVPNRVRTYNPKMKWIIIIRHPAYRAFSAWNMMRWRENPKEDLGFHSALVAEPDRLVLSKEFRTAFGYVDRSFYSEQIRQIFRYFPRSQVLVTTNRRLYCDPSRVVAEICEFLGVAVPRAIDPINIHQGNYVGETLEQDIKSRLIDEFSNDIRSTQSLTGLDLSSWLDPAYDETSARI